MEDFPSHSAEEMSPMNEHPPVLSDSNLPAEFIRKLQSWEKMKDMKGVHHKEAEFYKEKKIRARPLEQKQIQEEDLKPEFRLKVRISIIHNCCNIYSVLYTLGC